MRKALTLLVLAAAMLSLTACGGNQPIPEETVVVTIPMEFEGGRSDKDILRDAKQQDIQVKIDHDKETVTYTMTKVQQNDLLLSFKNNFEEELAEGGAVRDEFPFVKDVEYNDDMSDMRVLCNRDTYDSDRARDFADHLFASSITYQFYSGSKEDDINVNIIFVDAVNGEDLYTTNLRDAYAEKRNGDDRDIAVTED